MIIFFKKNHTLSIRPVSAIIRTFASKNMADNYLENKMEEHRRGLSRPATKSPTRRAGVLAPGLHLLFPPLWIVLTADTAEDAAPYLTAMRSAGINVALCCSDGGKATSALAQKMGARLYPASCETEHIISELAANGHTPSWTVCLRTTLSNSRTISPAETSKGIPAQILARELLFMLHPEHESLLEAQNLFDIRR